MMDVGSLDFSYSALAAAAFCHFSSFDVVHKVSGLFSFSVGSNSVIFALMFWLRTSFFMLFRYLFIYLFVFAGLTWDSILPCYRWMSPFMETLRSEDKPQLKSFPKVKSDDRHNIQTHVAYLELLVSQKHFLINR